MWSVFRLVLIFLLSIYACASEFYTTACPSICSCRLEHLTDTAIYRFMQNNQNKPLEKELQSVEVNDVIPEESLEMDIFQDKLIVRSATCVLQTETITETLLQELSKDIETLTIIQGYKTGNKTIKFGDLLDFKKLISLELVGSTLTPNTIKSGLHCEIDRPLLSLKYLSFENVLIKTSKNQVQNFIRGFDESQMTFEYTQKIDSDSHILTLLQQGTNEDVLLFEKFKEQGGLSNMPLFFGFKNLLLLRITSCNLNTVHWKMFDGLKTLEYLILENNNLHFIPPFAFYGTPNLKLLSLAHNNLLDIQITDLAGLLDLEFLDLTYNNFSQLSELSLPPFPKLKLANFGNNPISVVFPNTFEVMNTTDSLIIGSNDMVLSLMPNSFQGLNLLKTLTLKNLDIPVLKKELLKGMSNLKEFFASGSIPKIEFDAFLEVFNLEKLILSHCKVNDLSIDSFMGLEGLIYLDLSSNQIDYLPPGIFDQLTKLKELYLNNNLLKEVPYDLFSKLHVKLLRLNENPWQCSCAMSLWKPMIINKIKQKSIRSCDRSLDKGLNCPTTKNTYYKYIYDNKVAPKCASPNQYVNWSVFQVMRRLLKCPSFKPKIRQHNRLNVTSKHSEISTKLTNSNEIGVTNKIQHKYHKIKYLKYKHRKNHHFRNNTSHVIKKNNNNDNNINVLNFNEASNNTFGNDIDNNIINYNLEKNKI